MTEFDDIRERLSKLAIRQQATQRKIESLQHANTQAIGDFINAFEEQLTDAVSTHAEHIEQAEQTRLAMVAEVRDRVSVLLSRLTRRGDAG